MKKLLGLILVLIMFFSCAEENIGVDELNITMELVKNFSSETDEGTTVITLHEPQVEIFPNPFQNRLNLSCSSGDNYEVYIYNSEGSNKKFLIEGYETEFDFSEEKAGAYLIEVFVKGTVYREYVIKGE